MNKKIITSLIFAVLFLICAASCVDPKNNSSFGADSGETSVQISQDETKITSDENSVSTGIEDTSVTESNTSSTPADTEPIDDTISGIYYCSTDLFNAEYRSKYPGQNPYMSFDGDGNCVMLVGYGRGMCEVNGTYTIEEDKINVELDLTGTPFEGIDPASGNPYMDNKFIFEIVDSGHIIIGPADDSVYNGDCYAVRTGDSFIKE